MIVTNTIAILLIVSFTLVVIYVILQLVEAVVNNNMNTTLPHLIYLVVTRQLAHFIEKRKLVKGDLVIIRFRGKFRKAYIRDILHLYNECRVQITFEEPTLNIRDLHENWYPLSRIIVPEFLGKTAKLLFSESGV